MRYYSLLVCVLVSLVSNHVVAVSAYERKNTVTQKEKKILARDKPIELKTSLIIPCYYKHAGNLYPLLRMYEEQTRLPDEVVISLSEIQRVDSAILDELTHELWAFPITIVGSEKKQLAGENRNTACKYAVGDVFICQDADDIVHPQRIELIHYFFTHYDIDHLMHQYEMVFPDDQKSLFEGYINPEAVSFVWRDTYRETMKVGMLTNGNVAIARDVLKKVKWTNKPRGQDTEFNKNVYRKFKRCIAIRALLYGYRQYLSSAGTSNKTGDDFVVDPINQRNWPKRYKLKIIKKR